MTTPARQAIREWTMLALALVVIGTCAMFNRAGAVEREVGHVVTTQAEIKQNQAEAKIRGFKTRAAACRAIESAGGQWVQNDPCLAPEMHPYFTPQHQAP